MAQQQGRGGAVGSGFGVSGRPTQLISFPIRVRCQDLTGELRVLHWR